jgi:hypothetical protein
MKTRWSERMTVDPFRIDQWLAVRFDRGLIGTFNALILECQHSQPEDTGEFQAGYLMPSQVDQLSDGDTVVYKVPPGYLPFLRERGFPFIKLEQ